MPSLWIGTRFWAALVPVALTVLTGCASYQAHLDDSRRTLAANPNEAIELLEPRAKESSKDQLLYLLDYATALQLAGKNSESAKVFGEAERIADQKDYHSISKVGGSLLLSEEIVQYKGDEFEKVLINGMNALNYLEMGQLDGALVEVRRVNEKLYKLKSEGKNEFNQSPFAFYLGALIWEADHKYDDAYISYKNAYEVAPFYRPLREDLVRSSIQAQRPEELEKWKKAFPDVVVRPEWKDRSRGEVVLVFLNGWGPRKYPRPDMPRFPQLMSVPNPVTSALMSIAPEDSSNPVVVASTTIYSVDEVAIKALDADFGRLVASRAAGIATKAVVSDQIRQKNELLGNIAWLALNLADRADLRQWSTLPHAFQIARASVKAGKYKVAIRAIGSSAEKLIDVDIKPGKKTFIVWRVIY